jgi:hypothetical protein
MPLKLSLVQQDATRTLLQEQVPHLVIANAVGSSVGQVKKMSRNMNVFGDIYPPPGAVIQGRPLIIIEEAVEVRIPTIFHQDAELIFARVSTNCSWDGWICIARIYSIYCMTCTISTAV